MTDGPLAYLDTSAFVKLVVAEEHTGALVAWATEQEVRFAASDLLRTEALRAVRHEGADVVDAVHQRLGLVTCLTVTRSICDAAAGLPPTVLRTLDAIHVATALGLAPELEVVVTYDRRMAEAAEAAGLVVVAPEGP